MGLAKKKRPRHLEPAHFRVAPSGIPNAGVGLYAKQPIQNGDRLPHYGLLVGDDHDGGEATGHVAPTTEPRTGRYILYTRGSYIDGEPRDGQRSLLATANTSPHHNNAKFTKDGYAVATKTIARDEEVFISYGSGYRVAYTPPRTETMLRCIYDFMKNQPGHTASVSQVTEYMAAFHNKYSSNSVKAAMRQYRHWQPLLKKDDEVDQSVIRLYPGPPTNH